MVIREEFFHRSRFCTFEKGEMGAARQKRGGELQAPLCAARCGGAQPARQRGYVGTHKAIRIQEQGVVIAAGEIFDHSVERTGRGTETIPIGWRYQRKVLVQHIRARVWAVPIAQAVARQNDRSEEHTSELQSLMRISYAVFCLKKKNKNNNTTEII